MNIHLQSNKAQAQARAKQIQAFRAEQRMLAEQGLLNLPSETVSSINRYHDALLQQLHQQQDIDLTEQASHVSLGMQIVSCLGALALAASLFFLFYQYWGLFTTPLQVSILVLAPLLTLVLAVWFCRWDRSGYYAKLAALVSFMAWVLNIVMLGNIFNLSPSPNAFGLFALYGFLLAYLLHVRLLLAAAMLCSYIFISAKVSHWLGDYWLTAWEYPEYYLLTSLVFFLLPLKINQQRFDGFTTVYQQIAVVVFFIAVLILANWGAVSYLPWTDAWIEGSYQVVGFSCSALLIWYGMRQRQAGLMFTANIFFVLFLCSKFVDWWWDWLPKYLFFLLLGLTAILALMVFNRLRSSQQQDVEHG